MQIDFGQLLEIDFGQLLPYAPLLEAGAVLTCVVTVSAIALSFPLGLVGALIRVFGVRPFRIGVTIYVEAVRNVPFLVLLYLLYFGLAAFGLRINNLASGILALTLNSTAYTVEIFRGGLAGIPSSQYMGAASLGMRPFSVFRYVVFPQLWKLVAPSLGNQVVWVFLGSSLVSTIGVDELMGQTLVIGAATYRYLEVFIVAIVIYAGIAQILGLLMRRGTRGILRVRWS